MCLIRRFPSSSREVPVKFRGFGFPSATTMEEAQQLAAVCESPGNLKAYNMVLVWRHLASEVAPDQRTNEDRIVLEYPWTRPQWLPTTLPEPVVAPTPQSPPSGPAMVS